MEFLRAFSALIKRIELHGRMGTASGGVRFLLRGLSTAIDRLQRQWRLLMTTS